MNQIRHRLVKIPYFGRRFFLKYFTNHEGGSQNSETLRVYTKEKFHVEVGKYSYGGCFASDFNRGGVVSIGRYCSFASQVHYFGANHPIHFASDSPYFYNQSFGFSQVSDVKRSTLLVGHDVWFGYASIITCGCVKIGNGAVIGAGAVVTSDVPPYAIVAGNPARIIRYRFDDDCITALEESKWFQLEPEELMMEYDVIDNPKEFAAHILLRGKD